MMYHFVFPHIGEHEKPMAINVEEEDNNTIQEISLRRKYNTINFF